MVGDGLGRMLVVHKVLEWFVDGEVHVIVLD